MEQTHTPPEPVFHIRAASSALIEGAKRLYGAYTANAHNLNYQGKPCPAWDDLGDSVRSHWCATAAAAMEQWAELNALPPSAPPAMVACFVVDAVEPLNEGFELHARAVAAGDGNQGWSKWTPTAQLRMQITNPTLNDTFAAGQQYLVHFTRNLAEGNREHVPPQKQVPAQGVLSFGQALEVLDAGGAVARAGWNGKGMTLHLQRPDANSKMSLPYLFLHTASGDLVPWTASQTDILATDWIEV